MKDYKKILEGVVSIINTTEKSDIGFANICTYIGENCPELKESEDEKIRQLLLRFVKYDMSDNYSDDFTPADCVAWLEKQGEHAKFRDSIQVGDKVTRNQDGMLVNLSQLNRVAKKDEKQGKNNMGISKATKQKLEDNLNKALEKETPESWNEFLDEQGEHKPWSEEDEDILNTIINHFKVDIGCTDEDDMVRWLKSLKERYTWKPSEEQIKALANALSLAKNCGEESAFDLRTLYEQIKKLRED